MRRVADGERRGDGEGIDGHGGNRRLEGCNVKRLRLLAIVIMAAGDHRDGHAGEGFRDSCALRHGLVEADEDDAHRAAMAFDHGIGGERGGDGDQ